MARGKGGRRPNGRRRPKPGVAALERRDDRQGQSPAEAWQAAFITSLAQGPKAEALLKVTRQAMLHVDLTLEGNPPPSPLACKAGCSLCCHNQVSVTPMEAFALCEYLETTLDQAEREGVLERLNGVLAAIGALNRVQIYGLRQGLTCALLRDGLCLVYPVRPLVCRGWNSLNLEDCRASFDNPDPDAPIESYASRREYAEEVQTGLLMGAAALGLEAGYMVMARALGLVLGQGGRQQAMERWLKGEAVFRR